MATAFGKYLAATSLVGADDDGLPWCDTDIIANCELQAFEASKTSVNVDESGESFMGLSWALVHSNRPADINRGIGMLEAFESKPTKPLLEREKLYLLAVGHYRTGNYSMSRKHLEKCLEIDAHWGQALVLQNLLTERTKKDGAIGMAIATGTIGAIGFAVAGVVGAVGAVAMAAGGVIAMTRRT